MAEPRKIFDLNQRTEGRVPPQAVDVEMAVLCGMIMDKKAIDIVREVLDGTAFYKPAHQLIFDAILSLHDQSEPVDLVTLVEELRRRGQLEKVGGEYYLTEITSKSVTSANIDFHAHIVFEKALARRVISLTSELASRAFSETEDILELLEQGEKDFFSLSEFRIRQKPKKLSETLHETLEHLEKVHGHKTGVIGVPSGFSAIDGLTAGFQKGDLIVIAGRPSQGKSGLVRSMLRNMTKVYELKAGLFSHEMSTDQLNTLLIASEGRINSHDLRRGRLAEDEWRKVSAGAGLIYGLNLWIDETPNQSISDVRAKSRRLKHEHGVDLIAIDYLQLMRGIGNEKSREQEISTISRGLKALAKELNIPVIALSQLNRSVENRTDKRPVLADLRESGAIEQDADVVLFVHRPEMYGQMKVDDVSMEGVAEIIIAKQRMGPVGTVKLAFIKEYAKFENYARVDQQVQTTPEEAKRDLPF